MAEALSINIFHVTLYRDQLTLFKNGRNKQKDRKPTFTLKPTK